MNKDAPACPWRTDWALQPGPARTCKDKSPPGRTKTGRLWVYARDDRPWDGPDPPATIYLYSPDRKAQRPISHLARFKGTLQVDGYPGFVARCTGVSEEDAFLMICFERASASVKRWCG